jgi:hypothetical protein
MKKRGFVFLVLLLVTSTFVLGAQEDLPIKSKLYFEQKPTLNRTGVVVLEFTALKDLENVNASIKLIDPDAAEDTLFNRFELLENPAAWNGNLKKGGNVVIKAKVKVLEPGYYQIYSTIFADGYRGKKDRLFPRILKDKPPYKEGLVENGWRSSCGFAADSYKENFDANLSLVFTSSPLLSKDVGIIATVVSKQNISNAVVGLILPTKGFEVVSAQSTKKQASNKGSITVSDTEGCPTQLIWTGNLVSGEPFEIKVHTKVKEPGWGTLIFRIRKTVQLGDSIYNIGQREKLDIIVDKDFSKISNQVCENEECEQFDESIERKKKSLFEKTILWLKKQVNCYFGQNYFQEARCKKKIN